MEDNMSKRKLEGAIPIFCSRFKKLRLDRKLNQAEFAEYLGISRPTVGFYENGDRIPDAHMLLEIANKCEVSADYLLGLTENITVDTARIDILFGLSTKLIEYLQDERIRTVVYRLVESDRFKEFCVNAERMNLYSAMKLEIKKSKYKDTGQLLNVLIGNSERNYAFQLEQSIHDIYLARNEVDILDP
jgi:transcriptional regulator with XRE-family HTH domain